MDGGTSEFRCAAVGPITTLSPPRDTDGCALSSCCSPSPVHAPPSSGTSAEDRYPALSNIACSIQSGSTPYGGTHLPKLHTSRLSLRESTRWLRDGPNESDCHGRVPSVAYLAGGGTAVAPPVCTGGARGVVACRLVDYTYSASDYLTASMCSCLLLYSRCLVTVMEAVWGIDRSLAASPPNSLDPPRNMLHSATRGREAYPLRLSGLSGGCDAGGGTLWAVDVYVYVYAKLARGTLHRL